MEQCSQRDRLRANYMEAVNAYGEVLSKMSGGRYLDPTSLSHLTQERRRASHAALDAFVKHVKEHGCQETPAAGQP